MRKAIVMLVPAVLTVMLGGCINSGVHAIDMRCDGHLVMRIPYNSIESVTFLVTETKDGYYKLDKKSYTGDLLINELEKKPFLILKGVCLRLERPSSEQKQFVDALASMCVTRNLNLFIDEPGGDDITKESEDVDWVVRRELNR